MITNLKTMAMLIEDDHTYSVAVACLPPGFALYPFSDVKGHWLVINRLEARFSKKGTAKLMVVNTWMTEYQFTSRFELGQRVTDNWYLVTETSLR